MYPHIHKYKLDSRQSRNHQHIIAGHTDYMVGINIFHFHFFWGVCSHIGHTHYYSGVTGLPVKTENGHIHRIEGILELNNQHDHNFNSYTFEDIEYTGKRLFAVNKRWAMGGR